MKNYVTISAKIPRRLKELMDKYGIKHEPVIREALEKAALNELEKRQRNLVRSSLPYLTKILRKL